MDISLILTRRWPGLEWSITDNDYESLIWLSDSEKPSLKELENLWPEVRLEVETELVRELRRAAYTIEADPLFFAYQRGESTEKAWLDAVDAVKQRYPLPS